MILGGRRFSEWTPSVRLICFFLPLCIRAKIELTRNPHQNREVGFFAKGPLSIEPYLLVGAAVQR
jgi:hypothetical protein